MSYLYTCEACAPEGLSVEEYSTRPLGSVCLVCGAEARHWYTNAEKVLRALLVERKDRPQMTLKRIPYEEIAEFLKDDPSAMGTVAGLCGWEPPR
jgi:hypothetical protein